MSRFAGHVGVAAPKRLVAYGATFGGTMGAMKTAVKVNVALVNKREYSSCKRDCSCK